MGCGGEPPVCDLKVSEREVRVCGCLGVKNGGERICVHARLKDGRVLESVLRSVGVGFFFSSPVTQLFGVLSSSLNLLPVGNE